MNAIRKIISICLLIICLGAFAAQAEQDTYIGLYPYLGYYINGQFVYDKEQASWSVNLKADGKGSLYWGEDNQGETTWSMEDGKLTINAGVSVIEGVINDGIMLLDMGDGIIIGWAGPNVDFGKLDMITAEEYLQSGVPSGETPAEAAGVYFPFATARDGYCIAFPSKPEDGMFTLAEDGSATVPTGEVVNNFKWLVSGDAISILDETGSFAIFQGTLKDGIMMLEIGYTEADGSVISTQNYYAREGTDTSAIATITVEEYMALIEGQN